MDCYTLFELNQFIKRFVALNAPEPLWITAEISQVNFSKSHCYIDLIQKSEDDDQLIAHSQAVIWADQLSKIQKKKKTSIKDILKDGMEVKLRALVDFHERYGLKLVIDDLDENYTFGKLAIQKAETHKRLKKEKLLDKNGQLILNSPIRKVAVLSSVTAAGYKDFITHLENNEYGYRFKILLFSTAVQGMGVEEGFKDAFEDIAFHENFDCVAIIRGGGSKIDLSAFDNYEVCKTIANSSLPVLVGIGHEIDETLLDLTAHSSLKTPTAVADFIINRNLEYESTVHRLGLDISSLSRSIIKHHELRLASISNFLSSQAKNNMQQQNADLDKYAQAIKLLSKQKINSEKSNIDLFSKTFELLDVRKTLKRGFTITRKNGRVITSEDILEENDELSTEFESRTIFSIITKINP